jgi:hypothetical protein
LVSVVCRLCWEAGDAYTASMAGREGIID